MGSSSAFLAGIRVLDLSQFVPGPYASLLMSDLGADVVKVEPPAGDPQRRDGPLDDEGVSLWYRVMNRNKRVVSINLKTDDGRALFDLLVAACDVLLESFRPGVLARLGYPRERLAQLNPTLVHCALSGWGQNGPYRYRAGHDNNYQASVGVLDVAGTGEVPVAANPPIADFAGALQAFALVNAALLRRRDTGEGAYIDIGLADCALSLLGTDLVSVQARALDTRRGVGPYAGGWACYNTYECACGGFITVGALEPKFWKEFCQRADRTGWIPRQCEPLPQSALIGEVQAHMRTRTRAAWIEAMEGANACFHEVLSIAELQANPQVLARRVLREGDDGLADALLPAWINGVEPPARQPLRHADPQVIASDWVTQTCSQPASAKVAIASRVSTLPARLSMSCCILR